MSFSKTYQSHFLGGAHKPRPFWNPMISAKIFRIASSIHDSLPQRLCAFSKNPRHMLPHPFCGSALHSGHCPWHSMAFLGETWRRNMQTVQHHAPHHRIKYQTWNDLARLRVLWEYLSIPVLPCQTYITPTCFFPSILNFHFNHQAFQVPKMEVLTYISCM